MLTVILAGGKGTRILEETRHRPKAMVEIGGRPILQHIMDSFQRQGFDDFLILTGYKSDVIFRYFQAQEGILKQDGDRETASFYYPGCRVRLLDTGEETGSAARLRLAAPLIQGERFLLTYCDGLSSVSLKRLLDFHTTHGGLVTLTAVRPAPRFGILELGENGVVHAMREKSQKDSPIINGGFMAAERGLLDFLTESMEQLEPDVLMPIAAAGKMRAYYHDGFWQCMDTLQEKQTLCALWESGQAPWVTEGFRP